MKSEDLFKTNYKNLKPETGRLLISYPTLNDFYFKRSIVLLTEHNLKGSIGFVLNKEVKISLSSLVKDFPEIDALVSIGGPVSPETLHFIHRLGEKIPEAIHVVDDIYWGGDFEALKDLIKAGLVENSDLRFFLGYSGWAEGQLEAELDQDSWLVIKNEQVNLFQKKNVKWTEVVKRLGEDFRLWQNFPDDPSLN